MKGKASNMLISPPSNIARLDGEVNIAGTNTNTGGKSWFTSLIESFGGILSGVGNIIGSANGTNPPNTIVYGNPNQRESNAGMWAAVVIGGVILVVIVVVLARRK